MSVRTAKFKVGRYLYPVNIEDQGDRLDFHFKYNKDLVHEVKVLEGSRWHHEEKFWSAPKCQANDFRLAYLQGGNPYAPYDKPLVDYTPTRELMGHQVELVRHGLTYHYVLWAAEMGVGKSLAAIELLEFTGLADCLWLGPNSALNAVRLELNKWQARVPPKTMMTYDKMATEWVKGNIAIPRIVVADECSRCKNPTAKRTIALQALADAVRERYGQDGYVILMTGSPAPKSPFDWYSQCKIACPGFLKEGRFDMFKERLAKIARTDTDTGSFPSIVTWWDDELKCKECGKYQADNPEHDPDNIGLGGKHHPYAKSVNEVGKLPERLKGLVKVFLKKDCVDLPEKIYKIIKVAPSRDIINAARIIAARAKSAAECLILLRELSDGFQYQDTVVGQETCWGCHGKKVREQQVPRDDAVLDKPEPEPGDYVLMECPCDICKATGKVDVSKRSVLEFPCPKEEVILDLFDEYQDVGRTIVYGGFTGSITKLVALAKKATWDWIKADGHGWQTSLGALSNAQMLEGFQDKKLDKKIVFIGQPTAAGLGLNLSSSPVVAYYSNDFNAESRIQSENRHHRIDMDRERGCQVIDLFHLPTDKLVYDNLQRKLDLQSISMGDIRDSLNAEVIEQ